jgi:HAD superfamily hydrolase (TIGR01549 family)
MIVPKAIFFDLDNTLVDHSRAVHTGLEATVRNFPDPFRNIPFEEILTVFEEINDALWKEYSRGGLTPDELRRQRIESLLAWCEGRRGANGMLDATLIADISAYYVQQYVNSTAPFAGVEALLSVLADTHILGIISNGFGTSQQNKLAACNLEQFFQHRVYSEDIGVHKPDPLIFQVALKKAGVAPDEALYVGDNYFHDIYGAAYAGLMTIWYNTSGRVAETEHPRIEPDGIARSIPELAELLGVSISTTTTQ